MVVVDPVRLCALVLASALLASACGGGSDSAELEALREEVATLKAQATTLAPTTTRVAPTTTKAAPTTTRFIWERQPWTGSEWALVRRTVSEGPFYGDLSVCSNRVGVFDTLDCSYRDLSDIFFTIFASAELGLPKVNFTGANLAGASLPYMNLSGGNFYVADLTEAFLEGADLSGAYLYDTSLVRANLTGTDLTGAYLGKADITGADFTSAKANGLTIWPAGFDPKAAGVLFED